MLLYIMRDFKILRKKEYFSMINKFRLKTVATLGIGALSVLALASCKHTSYSSIAYDDVYASSGSYSITNGELWEELKWNSYEVLGEKIEYAVLADEVTEAQSAIAAICDDSSDLSVQKQKRYLDYLEQLAMSEVYGVSEIDAAKELTKKEQEDLAQQFVDNMYIDYQVVIDPQDLTPSTVEQNGKTMFADTKYEETYYLYDYYYKYEIKLAEKIFSYNYLEEYIEDYNDDQDDEDDYYFTDADVISYQKENYQYEADRTALYIRFTDEDEIANTLRSFGIKVSDGTMYFIPQADKTNTEYNSYYDDFDVTDQATADRRINFTQVVGDGGVFELYCQMYNYIYSYRDAVPTVVSAAGNDTLHRRDITEKILAYFNNNNVSVEDITAAWDSELIESFTYSQEDLDDIDTTFKQYISSTLQVEPDLADGEYRYSTSGYSIGDYYYMAFKMAEDELADEYVLVDDIENDTEIPEERSEYRAELIEEMMWEKLTDSYVSERISEALDDTKVYIYDEDVEIVYAYNVDSYSKTHKNAPTKDTLMTVVYDGNKTNITIGEVYEKLEAENGVTTAIDLLSEKAIKDTDEYADTKEDIDDYESTLDLLLAYFADGQISDYDASLGKYNFLKLYFHETDVDDIIDNYYRIQAATAKILTDYANNTAFYEMVQSYAKAAYTDSFTASATNIQIYVDMDEDGEADLDFDWSTAIPGDSSSTYADYAIELMQTFITRMENADETFATTLSSMVEEYTSSGRFTNGIDEYDGTNTEYDPTEPETRWAKYKRAGIYVTTTDYADVAISTYESSSDNTVATNSAKAKLHELYNTISLYDTYPSEYLDSADYDGDSAQGWLMTNSLGETMGYSMLLVTSCTVRSSAEFDSKDDVNGRYTNIVIEYDDIVKTIENIYNDSEDEASINQIILFIYEYLNYGTSTFFPSSVQSYITDFIMPVYEKYTGTATQRELLFAKTLSSSISFTDSDNDSRLTEMMAINRRQDDNYLDESDEAYLFDNWWTTVLTLGDGE